MEKIGIYFSWHNAKICIVLAYRQQAVEDMDTKIC